MRRGSAAAIVIEMSREDVADDGVWQLKGASLERCYDPVTAERNARYGTKSCVNRPMESQ